MASPSPTALTTDLATGHNAEVEARFADIVDELTRRGLLSGGLGAAALVGLAACGGNGGATATGSPSASSGTRTVASAKGAITLPAHPERVVAIAPQVRGTLYDLGITPIGVYDEGSEYISPRYRAKVADATIIGGGSGLQLEKIATLQPDLIVGVDYPYNTDDYTKLTVIAPTVIAPASTWQAIAQSTADAVNRQGVLQKIERRFATRAATIKKTYADLLARYRWDILQGGFDRGKFWLYGPKSDAGAILGAAGVRFATGSAGVHGGEDKALSYENIGLLQSADVIGFYANYDGTPNNQGPQLFAQTAFKALPAVTAGRTVPLPDFLPGGYGDALAVLDELEAGLKKIQENS